MKTFISGDVVKIASNIRYNYRLTIIRNSLGRVVKKGLIPEFYVVEFTIDTFDGRNWTVIHKSEIGHANEREKFLYYTHGSTALIDGENNEV